MQWCKYGGNLCTTSVTVCKFWTLNQPETTGQSLDKWWTESLLNVHTAGSTAASTTRTHTRTHTHKLLETQKAEVKCTAKDKHNTHMNHATSNLGSWAVCHKVQKWRCKWETNILVFFKLYSYAYKNVVCVATTACSKRHSTIRHTDCHCQHALCCQTYFRLSPYPNYQPRLRCKMQQKWATCTPHFLWHSFFSLS